MTDDAAADHKPDDKRWNLNIYYQRPLLESIPDHARTALDAGCGEGLLARTLAARGLEVTGIDIDRDSLVRARQQDTTGIQYLEADVLHADLPVAGFDVVTAVASLHHLDLEVGLRRLKELVAPGGVLLIVGLARSTWRDIPREMVASVTDKAHRLFRGYWDHGSPCCWPPAHTYDDVKRASTEILPLSEYRTALMWRYTITWTKPVTPGT